MIDNRVSFSTVCALALAVATIDAQNVFYATPPLQAEGTFMKALPPDPIGVIALDPLNVGRTVVNAPYSAEAITEVTQSLADGNRIEQRTSATVVRDSRGRTRREQQGIALGSFVAQNAQPIVMITDPKTGEHIMLNYERKVAFRSKAAWVTFNDKQGEQGPIVSYGASATMAQGGPNGPPPPPPPPEAVTFEARVFERSQMARLRTHVAGMPFEGEPRTEKLEPRTMEGLQAEGTKTTVTIAAGAMGNTLPIEIVSEQWYSPELGVVLLTRRSDPRFGETVYRLTNIDRSEPSPELFRIPSDFKVQNMSRGGPMPVKPNDQ